MLRDPLMFVAWVVLPDRASRLVGETDALLDDSRGCSLQLMYDRMVFNRARTHEAMAHASLLSQIASRRPR